MDRWIAERARCFDASGIRRVFDLGAKLVDPINLSIGQPDFEVPEPVRQAAIDAIDQGYNGYSVTQGAAVLHDKLQTRVDADLGHDDRRVLVTSGTSGGLFLALMMTVNPGDEVIVFDPYFVMYDALARVVGARVVHVDTYPDFRIDVDRVATAVTPRTKLILLNSPANPTGAVADEASVRALAELADQRDILLVSDEIYRDYCYDGSFVSPARFNPRTLVIDGFSKSHAMPGWRVGFAHGPAALIHEMTKLQQYSFVCAPHPFQWAAAAAMDLDNAPQIAAYRRKRDLVVQGLADCYELTAPQGAFYAFPKAPWGTGTQFVERAINEHKLLIIPGNVFSRRDTHFRISYAAPDAVIERGVEALRRMARE
ncbi:MAG: aminotransferase class I/II-fold pyridoxal phosphate-dependent enzyme [Pirellulales bacterium]|nr:aminotransferase class I/II-fold pyridoxal phosphate-dependent enzyme [Pirellulales bacterium]